MGGMIRNSTILLSVSYVQHRIVMITGTVHIGSVDFCGRVVKSVTLLLVQKIHTRQRGIIGQNRYKSDVVKHYYTTKTRVHGEQAPQTNVDRSR